MAGFSIIDAVDGVTKVAISTGVDSANKTAVLHSMGFSVSGVVTPVTSVAPMPVTGTLQFASGSTVGVSALPLPPGAATDASLATLITAMNALTAAVNTLNATERAPHGEVPMVVGTAQAAQRGVKVNCTAAGAVAYTYSDGSTGFTTVNVGTNFLAGEITTINSSGTTATATYANVK